MSVHIGLSSVRREPIYMTATPYECLDEICKEEGIDKGGKHLTDMGVSHGGNNKFMRYYHFKRDYSYLDIKYFSKHKELTDIITESVNEGEKWLIFIDNTNQCEKLKEGLDTIINKGTDDTKGTKETKVLTISSKSKNEDDYLSMAKEERLPKGVSVLISTSVIDNGINLKGDDKLKNIVISDISKVKCLQMVGRVRVGKDSNDKITLYIKRFNEKDMADKMKDIGDKVAAFHSYELAYEYEGTEDDNVKKAYEWDFLNKYYGEVEYFKTAIHLFWRDKVTPIQLHKNKIARSLVWDILEPKYRGISDEMQDTDVDLPITGQKYLEYQLAWFGKEYDDKNDITVNGYKSKEKLEFENYITENWLNKSLSKEEQNEFGKEFFNKYNPIFGLCLKKQGFHSDDNRGSKDGVKKSGYGIPRIQEIFEVRRMPFKVDNGNDGDIVIKMKPEPEHE